MTIMTTKVRTLRATLSGALALAIASAPTVSTANTLGPPGGDVARAESLSEKAVEAFEAQDYEEAVRLFQKAYDASPEPNYLFNIGRVYEEMGDLRNAVKYYQQFVGQPGVDLDARETALQRLKVLRDAVEQLEADEKKDEEPEETTPDPVVDQPPPTTEDDGMERKKKLRIAGYSLMGVGAAGLIVGGVFGGLALQSRNDAEDQPADRYEDAADEARTRARVADAMFITGGVLAATGLVLFLVTLGGKKNSASTSVANLRERRTLVTPQVSRTRFGLGLTHRF